MYKYLQQEKKVDTDYRYYFILFFLQTLSTYVVTLSVMSSLIYHLTHKRFQGKSLFIYITKSRSILTQNVDRHVQALCSDVCSNFLGGIE